MRMKYEEKIQLSEIPAAKIYFPEEDKKYILENIRKILDSGRLTLGNYGKQLEIEFAEYIGAKYAVTVNSGTSAIEIPMRIWDVKDHNIIVPTNTFFATPAAVIHAGGAVKFVDIDGDTFSVDVDSVNEGIDKNTKGIIIVHIGGIITPCIKEIKEICEDNNLFLFEDAAHAHGSSLNGKMAGTFGDAAAFSFYPTKVMTSGEGGMIVTDNPDVQKESLVYRDQGKSGFYGNVHVALGYNWRMSEIHAVLGLSQLKRLNEFVEERRKIAKIYDKGVKKIDGISSLNLPEEIKSNYYKYIVMLEEGIDRATLKKELKEKYNISLSGEVYELPCHLQPVFKNLGYKEGDFPVAEDICKRHICLPIFATMTEEQAKYVIESLEEVIS